jgi:predicted amidohydrolase
MRELTDVSLTRSLMTSPDAPVVRLAVAQTAPVLGDVARNARALVELSRRSGADLLLTPELSLTGYDVGDAVHELGIDLSGDRAPSALRENGCALVAGLIENAPGGPFNSAIVVSGETIVFRHRKLHLPTYGMFDEGRWFGRGSRLAVWSPTPGWTAGILICEDLWHPGLAYVLASRGIDLLLVQAAAPGRGVWEGGDRGAFASADVWERIARTTAQLYGIYVALSNRVGVEGGVTFAGGSLIVGPDGAVLDHADDRSECVLHAPLRRDVLAAARRPYAHSRDDDPALVLRELARALAD